MIVVIVIVGMIIKISIETETRFVVDGVDVERGCLCVCVSNVHVFSVDELIVATTHAHAQIRRGRLSIAAGCGRRASASASASGSSRAIRNTLPRRAATTTTTTRPRLRAGTRNAAITARVTMRPPHAVHGDSRVEPTRCVPDGVIAFIVIRPAVGVCDFDVEFVVRVQVLDDAGSDAQDFEHACCCAPEYDHGQHDDDEDGGAEGGGVDAFEARGEGDADGAAEAGPEEHCLVGEGEFVGDVFAAALGADSDEPVDRFG